VDDSSFPANAKAWLLFCLSSGGLIIFAILYFSKPTPSPEERSVLYTVTNFITNAVAGTVTNQVKVPAEIPSEYTYAMRLFQKMTNASYASTGELLFDMKNVHAVCVLGDEVKQLATDDEVKAKFELTLRLSIRRDEAGI
jgi:hypothetical protein